MVRAGRYVWHGARASGRGKFHWKLGAKKTGAQWPPLLGNVRQLFGGALPSVEIVAVKAKPVRVHADGFGTI